MKIQPKAPDDGYSLLEVITTLGLLSIVLMGSLSLLENLNKNQLTTQLMISRNTLVQFVQMNISNANALKKSLLDTTGTNAQYIACIQGGATSSACAVGPQAGRTSYDFLFYNQSGGVLAGPGSGPQQVFYDVNGSICTQGANSAVCVLQAVASFTAECPTASDIECMKANSVSIQVQVFKNPNITQAAASLLAPRVLTSTLLTSDINQDGVKCPASAPYVTGFNTNGSLLCMP